LTAAVQPASGTKSVPLRRHYRCPVDRPFLAAERPSTTILFGSLTPKHEAFIEAVFRGSGYLCRALPLPDKAAYETGKEYCNNGVCNPNYYTAGNLINFLRAQRRRGLSVQEIIDRYVYFTIGGCGPCRFGMYESEYKLALANAGFAGFRVFTFQSNRVIHEGSQQPGLSYTQNFGLEMMNALYFGDILFEMAYRIRPYEVDEGATDKAMAEVVKNLAGLLHAGCNYRFFRRSLHGKLGNAANILAKSCHHFGGEEWREALASARSRLNGIEVDWLRVKPVVKATGEFFSAISESDANHNLYRFLESEGAEVLVDPISNLIRYWIHQARGHNDRRKGLGSGYWRKEAALAFSEWFWEWQYRRTAERLGGLAQPLEPQDHFAQIARPYYDPLTRGGEGHLLIARALESSRRKLSHMMISVKPFGCMPATQADGVLFMLAAHEPDLLFLPVETMGDSAIHALSRVQMALGEARGKAMAEFDAALRESGFTLAQIRDYVSRHPETKRPFYAFRDAEGTGTAARFVRHIAHQMRGRQ